MLAKWNVNVALCVLYTLFLFLELAAFLKQSFQLLASAIITIICSV